MPPQTPHYQSGNTPPLIIGSVNRSGLSVLDHLALNTTAGGTVSEADLVAALRAVSDPIVTVGLPTAD
jgi:hypothetical protein